MIADIASIATAVGVLLAACGLFSQVRQRKSDLSQTYVERYWKLDDRREDRTTPPGVESRNNLERYWRLCEDEFDIVRLGWISGRTWCLWHESIRDDRRLHKDTISASRGYRQLSKCLTSDSHRPWRCPGLEPLSRWRRILAELQALVYKGSYVTVPEAEDEFSSVALGRQATE